MGQPLEEKLWYLCLRVSPCWFRFRFPVMFGVCVCVFARVGFFCVCGFLGESGLGDFLRRLAVLIHWMSRRSRRVGVFNGIR